MIDAINRQSTVLPGDFTGTLKAQNLDQAAEQFEAMFLRSMMQQMRKASDALAADDDPFNSKQQRMMRDFMMTNWPRSWLHSAVAESPPC